VQDLVKQQTLKEPKLAQLDKVLYKLFTAVLEKVLQFISLQGMLPYVVAPYRCIFLRLS